MKIVIRNIIKNIMNNTMRNVTTSILKNTINMIRNIILIIMVLLLITSSTGCKSRFLPTRREIDDLQLVQVLGVDKSEENPEEIMITLASKRLTDGSSQNSDKTTEGHGSSGTKKALIETARGKTIFEAIRNVQTHSDKTIFWGHTGYFLIGEEAAKENINKFIDFITRDHEFRIDAKIFIVKGSTAKELMEEINKTEYFIYDKLTSLGKSLEFLSISEEMKVSDLMRFFDIHHSSARVPCIELVTRENEKNAKIHDIDFYGYSIFKDLKLVGFIGRDISRGVNFITNNITSSIIVVKDPLGQNISLEIIQSNTNVIPHFIGDTLKEITIKVKVLSNLGEVQSQIEAINENLIHYMEQQQSEIIKKEIEDVIQLVLELKSDCLEICDKIRVSRPIKWHKIENQWMEIISTVKINVQVESKIERTYELREPSGYKGEN